MLSMIKKYCNKTLKNKFVAKNVYVITSSIACGKSTFLKFAKQNGIFCISADEISSKVFCYKSKQIAKKLKISSSYFKTLNLKEKKQIVADIIFKDKKAKKKLEKIMHSKIKKEIINKIKNSKHKIIFVEIPLYFENRNYNFLLNKIVIYCPYDLSLKRLVNRNNLSFDEAKLRLNSQINIEEKIKFATFLIKNDDNLEDFKENSFKLIEKIKEKHGIS